MEILRISPILFFLVCTACTGKLSLNPLESAQLSTPTPASVTPTPVPTTPTTTFLYRVGPNSDKIYRANVGTPSGALTELTPTNLTAGDAPIYAVTSLDKRFLFVGKSGPKTIDTYSLNQTTGEPAFLFSTLTTQAPIKVRMEPLGRYLYSLEDGFIESYTINADGSLSWSEATGIVSGGRDITFDAGGAHLYKSAIGTGMQSYAINQSNGMLSNPSTMIGQVLNVMKIDPNTNKLFGPNYSTSTFYRFTVDPATGGIGFDNLLLPDNVPFPFYDLQLNAAGTRAYSLNTQLGEIHAYSIDPVTENFTLLNVVSVSSGCVPQSLEILESIGVLYTACLDNSGNTFVLKIETDGSVSMSSSTTVSGLTAQSVLSVTF